MLRRTRTRVARFAPDIRFCRTLQRRGAGRWSFTGPPPSPTDRVQWVVPVYVFLSNPAPGQPEQVIRALGDFLAEFGLELEHRSDD